MGSLEKNYESFMTLNVKKYCDKWIAMIDGKVVSSGKSFKKVFSDTKTLYPTKRPLISKIHSKKTLIL